MSIEPDSETVFVTRWQDCFTNGCNQALVKANQHGSVEIVKIFRVIFCWFTCQRMAWSRHSSWLLISHSYLNANQYLNFRVLTNFKTQARPIIISYSRYPVRAFPASAISILFVLNIRYLKAENEKINISKLSNFLF